MEWQDFDIFHLPPHCLEVEVEVERTLPYGGSERQVIVAYYDAVLNEVRNTWGRVRGTVLRWKVIGPLTIKE